MNSLIIDFCLRFGFCRLAAGVEVDVDGSFNEFAEAVHHPTADPDNKRHYGRRDDGYKGDKNGIIIGKACKKADDRCDPDNYDRYPAVPFCEAFDLGSDVVEVE